MIGVLVTMEGMNEMINASSEGVGSFDIPGETIRTLSLVGFPCFRETEIDLFH